jgi:hypothetical protein
MFLYIVVVVPILLVIVALVLIYIKLSKLMDVLEESIGRTDWSWSRILSNANYCYKELRDVNTRITELSNMQTINNPAWGNESASEKKKANIIQLYTGHIVTQENLSEKDALCKSSFIINQFGEQGLIDDMNRKAKWKIEAESEANLRLADFFLSDIRRASEKFKPKDIYIPLFVAVAMKEYKKDDKMWQRDTGSYYHYDGFLEDAAIIYKLSELGILKKEALHSDGKYTYILTETDLDVLRKIICGDHDKDCLDRLDWAERDAEYEWRNNDIKLPFTRSEHES